MMLISTSSRVNFTTRTRQPAPACRSQTQPPIRLHLKDDQWTIESLALRTLRDTHPFIQLAGTFDAKTEAMNFQGGADGFALAPFAPTFGLPDDVLQRGRGWLCYEHNRDPCASRACIGMDVAKVSTENRGSAMFISAMLVVTLRIRTKRCASKTALLSFSVTM